MSSVLPSSAPFAAKSVSIRVYPHDELGATDVVTELCRQARLALDRGFDGVMTSEHHGGLAGYLPNPLQLTGFILDENEHGWAAPCPLLLPLRPTALVAEEIAWLDARHPGRVGLGVAAGALPLDFTAMGLDVADAPRRFKEELPRIVDMLRGKDLHGLDGDQALRQRADAPIPVLSAAASPEASRRAARGQAGILLEGMSATDRLRRLCAEYDRAGGSGAKVLIRRVWIGTELTDLIESQRRVYQSYASSQQSFGPDQTVVATDPEVVAARLHETLVATGADALNLRVHLPGTSPEAVRDQIARLADEVLPALRSRLISRQERLASGPPASG